MEQEEKRRIIERYLAAYNSFDIDGMMALIHPEVEFKNISGGEVNATANGTEEFRKLAEWSNALFTSRKQAVTSYREDGETAYTDVDYEAVLATDMPNGMKAGETFRIKGRSEFRFRDGKICGITDIS
jgi:ketosteroid isomerase-like protein